MNSPAKTQHVRSICGGGPGRGPAFGRKVAGCPRCDELLAGAAPRALSEHRQAIVDTAQARTGADAQRVLDMEEHFASAAHRAGQCNGGLPCTRFDW